jgi:hypothetical protein
MEALRALQSLGLELPSPIYIFGVVVFGVLGWVAWRRGRRQSEPMVKWLGVALMFYPYAVSNTWLLYALGLALCAGIYFSADVGA